MLPSLSPLRIGTRTCVRKDSEVRTHTGPHTEVVRDEEWEVGGGDPWYTVGVQCPRWSSTEGGMGRGRGARCCGTGGTENRVPVSTTVSARLSKEEGDLKGFLSLVSPGIIY